MDFVPATRTTSRDCRYRLAPARSASRQRRERHRSSTRCGSSGSASHAIADLPPPAALDRGLDQRPGGVTHPGSHPRRRGQPQPAVHRRASAPTIPRRAMSRASNCSTPTWPRRIEMVRGPQSALWGSEAIGGVIAVDGTAAIATGTSALVEGGSFGFRRVAGSARYGGRPSASRWPWVISRPTGSTVSTAAATATVFRAMSPADWRDGLPSTSSH